VCLSYLRLQRVSVLRNYGMLNVNIIVDLYLISAVSTTRTTAQFSLLELLASVYYL
jgi:hypothetical protein